jgi:8-oxo-dGTP diphosphatase
VDSDAPVRVRVGAYALCVEDGRILLTQVWDEDPYPACWTLPGGGLDFGEQPADGVLRELREETGLSGRVEALVDVSSYAFGPWRDQGPLHHVCVIYRIRASGDPIIVEIDGTTVAARWFTLDEAAQLDLAPLATDALELAAQLR